MSDPQTTSHIDEIWRGSTGLHWAADCFGATDRALYAGGINVGHLMHQSAPRYQKNGMSWRAWVMTDEDGKEVGWFATEQEARDALVDAVVKELCK